MTKPEEPYHKHVDFLEAGLAPYAKRSFEAAKPAFVDGAIIHDTYEAIWRTTQGQLKLRHRTPLQVERDRILYSSGLRKQTDKYHVLYNGQRRIVRNYTTHSMRMAHVTRSICRALRLNADFAEAIALGSKIGAVPFIHAAKKPVSDWVIKKIKDIDRDYEKSAPLRRAPSETIQADLFAQSKETDLPRWISDLKSSTVLDKVKTYIPWAIGRNVDAAYTAGQESYWLLCTNPFTREARQAAFSPDTMFGIWRHTRGLSTNPESFHHRAPLEGATAGFLEIRWDHITYESLVVQYADDITWIIENLSDANDAALLNRRGSLYDELTKVLGESIPDGLLRPLSARDSGGIYTYFIEDFVRQSINILEDLNDGAIDRAALNTGDRKAIIGLSDEAKNQLDKIEKFLRIRVFTEPRVKNRTMMLSTISQACLDLLYTGVDDVLPRIISERAALEGWLTERADSALILLRDDVHRVQLAVDIFANMADQEIYDFVGIQSL
ncbi:MAG: hypothetical protein IAE99_00815 [Rhodothermales bacterium]|nr:hypothetical protein [Rhodothermales bacterium]